MRDISCFYWKWSIKCSNSEFAHYFLFSLVKQRKANLRNRTKPSTNVFHQTILLFTLFSRVILLGNNINSSFSHRWNWRLHTFFFAFILESLFRLSQNEKHVCYNIYSYNFSSNCFLLNQFLFFYKYKQKYQDSFEGGRNKKSENSTHLKANQKDP